MCDSQCHCLDKKVLNQQQWVPSLTTNILSLFTHAVLSSGIQRDLNGHNGSQLRLMLFIRLQSILLALDFCIFFFFISDSERGKTILLFQFIQTLILKDLDDICLRWKKWKRDDNTLYQRDDRFSWRKSNIALMIICKPKNTKLIIKR